MAFLRFESLWNGSLAIVSNLLKLKGWKTYIKLHEYLKKIFRNLIKII